MAHSDIEQQALQNCEDEPIRTPETIQPHGCVCVCDADFEIISHVSQNSEKYLNGQPSGILGQPLNKVFDRKFCHAVRNAASLRTITTQREYLGEYDFGAGRFEAACHLRGDHLIIEMGKCSDGHARHGLDINRLRWLMSKWSPDDYPLGDVLDITVHDLRMLTGFDRVMAYRFRPDGSGEVITESLAPETESFLGLRFPKWDIPETARAISLEQPLRLISDIESADIPLLAYREHIPPVDMTLTDLRGTSPIHKKYLSNMDVKSSLVIPVIIDGMLWGMFSMHHSVCRSFSIQESLSIELVAQMLNSHMNRIIRQDRETTIQDYSSLFQDFFKQTTSKERYSIIDKKWQSAATGICEALKLDGILLKLEDATYVYGLTKKVGLNSLVDELRRTSTAQIYASDQINLGKIRGAMRCELYGESGNCFWFFRREENQTIRWAGSPNKSLESEGSNSVLNPRSSFKEYLQQSKGKSRSWDPEDVMFADAIRVALNAEIQDEAQRIDMVRNFEVNSSTNVLSGFPDLARTILHASEADDGDPSVALQDFHRRMSTLISMHDDMRNSEPRRMDLLRVLEKYFVLADHTHNKSLHSTPYLNARSALSVGMVFQELTAAVFQEQKDGDATIEVEWINENTAIRIVIRGKANSKVEENNDNMRYLNFARDVIKRHISGHLIFEKENNNYVVNTTISLGEFYEEPIDTDASLTTLHDEPISIIKPPKRVIIIGANEVTAVHIRSIIRSMGYGNVHIAHINGSSFSSRSFDDVDFAIVENRDSNLHGKEAMAVLRSLGVPFALLSARGDEPELMTNHGCTVVLSKPLNKETIAKKLSPLLTGDKVKPSMSILLIEDNLSLQCELRNSITNLGHIVQCAATVPEAEAILRNSKVDAIILDLFIDIGEGEIKEGTLRIVNRIRNDIRHGYLVDKDIPILAISGAAEVPGGFSPLKTAAQIGTDKGLRKPIVISELTEWIRSVQDP